MFYYLQKINGSASGLTGSNFNSIGDVLGLILNVMIGVGISLSIIFIGFSGIRVITSLADPKKYATAMKSFYYSLLGLLLTFAVLLIRIILLNIVGIGGDLQNATPTF
ncbi:hypothetical protein H6802_00955 [Candidatus Nomurabacteria bacterium]|nr:hypothetical protein [Candidatus Nomurabacteria bacterium]MCB9827308.1 hypothetical protein [Candidatus Nomurabacteria bacterium]